MVKFTVCEEGKANFQFHIKGRELWALQRLIRAKGMRCAPITEPAPRWSVYIQKLRKQGVAIEVITERQQGHYPAYRARYVLRCTVTAKGGAA